MPTIAFRTLIVTTLLVVYCGRSYGDIFTVDTASGQLTLRGTDFSTDVDFANTFPLPQSGTMSLTRPGAAASTDYSFSDAGFVLSNLSYSLDPKAFAESSADFRITPLVGIEYTITGSLNPTGGFGTPTIFGHVADITLGEPGTNLFNQQVQKAGTANQSVSLTPNMGTLLSGHEYLVSFDIGQDTAQVNNTQIDATGSESILFVATPEPSSFILAALGLIGLAAFELIATLTKENTKVTRTISLTALLVMAWALCVGTASAGLIGTPVTGSFVTPFVLTNFFDPVNGLVTAGYLNVAGTTVTIAEPAIEFGIVDPGLNTDTANFTGSQLIVTDTVFSNADPWTMTFTDPAFTSLAKFSDSFTNGGVTGTLVGDTITVTWSGTRTADGLLTATFNVVSVPEPSSFILAAFGMIGLVAWGWRKHRA